VGTGSDRFSWRRWAALEVSRTVGTSVLQRSVVFDRKCDFSLYEFIGVVSYRINDCMRIKGP